MGPLIGAATADAKEIHGVVTEDTNNATEDSEAGGGRLPMWVDTKPEQKKRMKARGNRETMAHKQSARWKAEVGHYGQTKNHQTGVL